jgi:ABC-type lipoprotein release transport system permease subunit
LSVNDPTVYVAVSIVLALTAAIAKVDPSRRATSADPVHALHQN